MSIFKILFHIFSSMRTALILLLVIAVSSAVATFIESDFGSSAARAAVYNSRWFEAAIFLLAVTLIANMVRFSMWRKLSIFVFHASILIIIFGAFITRYFGYEGTMHIRNGESSNLILSSESYIRISSSGLNAAFPVMLSPISAPSYEFSANLGGGAPIVVKTKAFYANATEKVLPESGGNAFVSLLISTGGTEPIPVELFEGEYIDLGTVILAFSNSADTEKPSIVISRDQDQLTIRAYSDLTQIDMDTQATTSLIAHTVHPFDTRRLYATLDGINVVLREHFSAASRQIVEATTKTGVSAVVLEASHKGETREVALLGGGGMTGQSAEIELAGRPFVLNYGSAAIELPFSLKLDRFLLERYPGSQSPSSYESRVTLIDGDISEQHRIYMNNILVHKGFRFYQSSYDRDEEGTVLSVSNDPGVWITYLGYTILSLGFFAAFFSPKSRFRQIASELDKARRHRFGALLIAALFALFAPNNGVADDRILGIVDPSHAEHFSKLLVQDNGGRVKPMDTLAIDAVSKMTGRSSFKSLSASQVFLGMMSAPREWQQVKMIRVGHPEVALLLGLDANAKEAAFEDFFEFQANDTEQGYSYKLSEHASEASRTKDSDRSKFQKEIIKIDERVNIAYLVYQSYLLRIIPIKNDPRFTWIAPPQMMESLSPADVKEAATTLHEYLVALKAAQTDGSWAKANEALDALKSYQARNGAAIIPSQTRVNAEITLNRLNPFDLLMPVYFLTGLILLIFAFMTVLFPKASGSFKLLRLLFVAIVVLAFLFHTFALGLRWYVSDHAPWSNGYESIIYIAWATLLAGLIFARTSAFALPAATLMAGFTTMTAHLSAMDPQITTLVPVLKSYWLTIHVSVISGSYGFLGLSMLLGLIALALFALRRIWRLDYAIKDIMRINEMSMMFGLALLSIGNIFGAIWANESWGRYWSWDPKETWTLISMIVYATILHLRFIPSAKSLYALALASVLGFFVILMTYFGVNYYLAGMHSYASGDPVPVPWWLPPALITLAALSALAWLGRDSKVPLER
ncbi:cytochrome c biogenesis protein [Campylobacterota bacterium]|nr:cytochrome c biogenesis protein [Campylobacterota bacterium]